MIASDLRPEKTNHTVSFKTHNSSILVLAIRVATDHFPGVGTLVGTDVCVCYLTTLLHFRTLAGIHSLFQALLCYKERGTASWAASKRFFRKLFRGSEKEISREQREMAGTVWSYLDLLFWDQTCDSDRRLGDPQISYG